MTCAECNGSGFVWVDRTYVKRHLDKLRHPNAGQLPLTPAGLDPPAEPDAPRPVLPGTEEALADSVVPCFGCRTKQYQRWSDGTYKASTAAPARTRTRTRRR